MTKREAAEKVVKLRRLAARAGTPAEAKTAAETAKKIAAEYGLTSRDVEVEAKISAFDELVERLRDYGRTHPDLTIPGVVLDELSGRMRTDATAEEKAKAVDAVMFAVDAASIAEKLVGGSTASRLWKKIVDEVLRKHGVSV